MEVYIVYLDFDYYGHWEDRTIGIYSSEEKARKAADSYIKDHTDPENGEIDIPDADVWWLCISKVTVDDNHKERLVYAYYNSSQGENNE